MPDGRHHDPHIEGELVGTGLCKEVALKEHAGPFAELDHRTVRRRMIWNIRGDFGAEVIGSSGSGYAA